MGNITTESDDTFNASSLQAIVRHVLFPKNLPQADERENIVESALLTTISKFTQDTFSGGEFEKNGIPKTTATMLNWASLQSTVGNSFSLNNELSKLQEGDSTVLYIHRQNCTIIFTKVDASHMRLMTFRASLPNEEIMSTAGSLKATYPETIEIVPISKLLLSPTFSRHVEALTLQFCDLAMPKSRKGNQTFVETRQVANPLIVSEFLVGMLQPIAKHEYNELIKSRIQTTKKVRDEINWKSCALPFRRSGLWMSAKVVLQLGLQEELGNENEAKLAYKIILLRMITHIFNEFVKLQPHNWDTISQMLVKLARRARKLSELSIEFKKPKMGAVLKSTLETTFKRIETMHCIAHSSWKNVELTTSSEIGGIFRTQKEFQKDTEHEMEALTQYLNTVREPNQFGSLANVQELQFQRNRTLTELLVAERAFYSTVKEDTPAA